MSFIPRVREEASGAHSSMCVQGQLVLGYLCEVLWMVLKSELISLLMISPHFFMPLTAVRYHASICYTVIYMIRVGLGLG